MERSTASDGRRKAARRAALSFRDLARRVKGDGGTYRLKEHGADEGSALLLGDFSVTDLHSGLRSHTTDAVEQQDGSTEILLPPELTVSVLLEGTPSATLGGRSLCYGEPSVVRGKIWSLTRPTRLIRRTEQGRRVRKVNVSVTPEWLDAVYERDDPASANLRRFAGTHLAMMDWAPSEVTVRYAEEILASTERPGGSGRLSLEMRALGILRDAFALFDPVSAVGPGRGRRSPNQDAARARAAWAYIDAHLDQPLTLGKIAKANGMSVSTLQRVFKTTYGVTVIDHLRTCRLDLARKALVVDGLAIQQAAHLAGYSSAANFTTAFRRQFGYAPSSCLR